MYTVFQCGKCEHMLYVQSSDDFQHKLESVAGMYCPACGEQYEGLWRLLGNAKSFSDMPVAKWQETEDENE